MLFSVIDGNEGGMLFLDAPGGTGKTFLINLILAKLHFEGNIALHRVGLLQHC